MGAWLKNRGGCDGTHYFLSNRRGSSKADLEATVRAGYQDKGLVTTKEVEVKGWRVEYLEAGTGERAVVFCHGAAFSASTWQSVGVLDALAERGYRAVAVNLPGYGNTSRGGSRDSFLKDFVGKLQLGKIVVVAASMGGAYALPYVLRDRDEVAGYVTVAGLITGIMDTDVPSLLIYGELDPRLKADAAFTPHFTHSQLVVFDNAPHPAYLRDLDAARQFTALVLAFIGETGTDYSTNVHANW